MPESQVTDEQVDTTVFVSNGAHPLTANGNAGGHQWNNVAPGVAPTDAVNVSQLGGAGGPSFFSGQNKDVATIFEGMAVCVDGSGVGVERAAAADESRVAVGLTMTDVVPLAAGNYQTDGTFTLADWTAVTGSVSLAARGLYFLDPVNPGKLTLVPPIVPGQIVQLVGQAVTPQELSVLLDVPILL